MDSREAAAKIKAASRKTLTLPGSGAEIIIRKLQPYDFIGHEGMQDKILRLMNIPTQSLTAAANQPASLAERNLEFEKQFLMHIVSRAVVSPRVVIDKEPAEDEVAFTDLADDAEHIFSEAIAFSGMTGEVEMVEKFREVQGQEPTGD